MDSLLWVDQTYVQKHKAEDPHNLRALYHQNLEQYPTRAPKPDKSEQGKTPLKKAVVAFAVKQGRKAAISLAVLALSYVPYIGRFVLPAASFYTFRKAVGTQPAGAIFAASLLFPRRYLVTFLQAYFSSRTLMRELVCCIIDHRFHKSPLLMYSARAILCPRALQPRTEETLVQGSCWRTFWVWPRFLRLRENPPCRRPHLWSSGSVNGIPHHKGHRSSTATCRS